jgi:hypothetical protein
MVGGVRDFIAEFVRAAKRRQNRKLMEDSAYSQEDIQSHFKAITLTWLWPRPGECALPPPACK